MQQVGKGTKAQAAGGQVTREPIWLVTGYRGESKQDGLEQVREGLGHVRVPLGRRWRASDAFEHRTNLCSRQVSAGVWPRVELSLKPPHTRAARTPLRCLVSHCTQGPGCLGLFRGTFPPSSTSDTCVGVGSQRPGSSPYRSGEGTPGSCPLMA